MNYNRVIIGGTLTRDPEVRNTQGGQAVCKFGLAVNRRYTSNGESREEVSFFDCEVWGKTANTIAEFFKKGNRILVDGRLKQETWEKDGEKKSKVIISVENFQFVDRKQQGEEQEPPARRSVRAQAKPRTDEVSHDDIPF